MVQPNAAVLSAIFQEHYEELLRFLARRLGDVERAADLAQDIYLKLARLPPGGDIDNPRAYIYKIAGNLVIDTARRDGRLGTWIGAIEDAADVADPAPSAEAGFLAKERLQLVDAALDELSPKARLALLLFRVHGSSHAEIACWLGVSESMVAKYVAQAMRHCRDRLWAAERD